MIPQTQRWRRGAVFRDDEQTDEGGDCFSACIASILEVDVEKFPNYLADVDGKTWWDRWQDYLYTHYRSRLITFEDKTEFPDYKLIAWWAGVVMVGAVPHSVVFYQNEFRWDPMPYPYKKEYNLSDVTSMTLIYSIGTIFEEVTDD